MRKKLTKIALAATFGLALAFTFSCTSDGGGGGTQGTGVCLATMPDMGFGVVRMCMESQTINLTNCDLLNQEKEPEDPDFVFISKCPDAPNLKCPSPEEGPFPAGTFEVSVYNPIYNYFTCDDLFDDDDDDEF